jgi:hypothetical protein
MTRWKPVETDEPRLDGPHGRDAHPMTVAQRSLSDRSLAALARLNAMVQARGGTCLTVHQGRTVDSHTFECAAGHRWEALGSSVLRGSWCTVCARPQAAINRRSKDGLEQLQRAATAKGGECLSPTYVGGSYRHRFRCAKGHEWETVANTILKSGRWCPHCNHDAKRSGIEAMRAVAHARGGQCLSDIYVNQHGKLSWECHRGHVWHARACNVVSGCWCPECARLALIVLAKSSWKRRKSEAKG